MPSHKRYNEEQKHFIAQNLKRNKADVIAEFRARYGDQEFGLSQYKYLRGELGKDPAYGAPLLQDGTFVPSPYSPAGTNPNTTPRTGSKRLLDGSPDDDLERRRLFGLSPPALGAMPGGGGPSNFGEPPGHVSHPPASGLMAVPFAQQHQQPFGHNFDVEYGAGAWQLAPDHQNPAGYGSAASGLGVFGGGNEHPFSGASYPEPGQAHNPTPEEHYDGQNPPIQTSIRTPDGHHSVQVSHPRRKSPQQTWEQTWKPTSQQQQRSERRDPSSICGPAEGSFGMGGLVTTPWRPVEWQQSPTPAAAAGDLPHPPRPPPSHAFSPVNAEAAACDLPTCPVMPGIAHTHHQDGSLTFPSVETVAALIQTAHHRRMSQTAAAAAGGAPGNDAHGLSLAAASGGADGNTVRTYLGDWLQQAPADGAPEGNGDGGRGGEDNGPGEAKAEHAAKGVGEGKIPEAEGPPPGSEPAVPFFDSDFGGEDHSGGAALGYAYQGWHL